MNSVFTDYLQLLGKYSGRVDAARISPDDYAEFQQAGQRITAAHEKGYFGADEHRALMTIFNRIDDDARFLLKVSAGVE